jgi:hypothetical protein
MNDRPQPESCAPKLSDTVSIADGEAAFQVIQDAVLGCQ